MKIIQYNSFFSKMYFSLLLFALSFGNGLYAQTLEEFIEIGTTNSPQLKALELEYKVSKEKIKEVNSLPNTEFGAGYFLSEPETRTGAQKAKFSVKQMLPWFGTIQKREDFAQANADKSFVAIRLARKELILEITENFYKLYAVKAKQRVLNQNINLLKTYAELAINAVEVNKTSMVKVLELQIRQNELTEQRDLLQGEEMALESSFNNLLNQEEMLLSVPDSIGLPEEEPLLMVEELKNHPELAQYDKKISALKSAQKLNDKEARPNFGVGVDYIAIEERPDMQMPDNGKDIVMPMFSVSIPIFNNKFKSLHTQYELQQSIAEAERTSQKNKLDSKLKTAIQNRISARISYNTQQKNINQAQQAEEVLLVQYENDRLDFNDVLEIQALQLKFQLKKIEAVKNYYIQSAIIEYVAD